MFEDWMMRDSTVASWAVFIKLMSTIGSGFLYFAAIWVVYELGMAFIDKL